MPRSYMGIVFPGLSDRIFWQSVWKNAALDEYWLDIGVEMLSPVMTTTGFAAVFIRARWSAGMIVGCGGVGSGACWGTMYLRRFEASVAPFPMKCTPDASPHVRFMAR